MLKWGIADRDAYKKALIDCFNKYGIQLNHIGIGRITWQHIHYGILYSNIKSLFLLFSETMLKVEKMIVRLNRLEKALLKTYLITLFPQSLGGLLPKRFTSG